MDNSQNHNHQSNLQDTFALSKYFFLCFPPDIVWRAYSFFEDLEQKVVNVISHILKMKHFQFVY